MEKIFSKAEEMVEHVKEYVNNRTDQLKLNTSEQTAKLLSYLIATGIITAMVIFFVLFAGVALSLFLGEVLGKPYWGFLITGGFLLLLAWLLWVFRRSVLQYPIMNGLIQQLFKSEEENDDDEN